MSPEQRAAQQAVTEWFDAVYRRKGTRYLRPLEAYSIFPALLRARPEHRLLDVACGPGLLLRAACAYTKRLHGIDISRVALARAAAAGTGARVVCGNAEALPYRDGTFDLVVCLGSLERMLDLKAALRELLRVGKRDARYCFLVRNSNTLSWKYLRPIEAKQRAAGHAGAKTLQQWQAVFESTGLRTTAVLPDQYPLHRRRRWWAFWAVDPVDYRAPISSSAPLERANEFLFLLEKQE